MNRIDVTDKVNWQSSWEEDELLGLKFCPECNFNYGNDFLLVSIEECNAYECKNCHTKFVLVQHRPTVFKLDDFELDKDGPIAQQ